MLGLTEREKVKPTDSSRAEVMRPMHDDTDAAAATGSSRHALDAWFRSHVPEAEPPLTIARIAGGMSNLTFRISDVTGRQFVLRRPPLGAVTASAHDVSREFRILGALASTDVPVPRVRGEGIGSQDGSPFYVMDFVTGSILRSPEDATRLSIEQRRQVSFELVDCLARIHRVDIEKAGLGELRRPGNYVARQLKRLRRQLESDATCPPLVLNVCDDLARQIPHQMVTSLLHGDFRLDNVLVSADAHLAAVLDWELASTGDPRADLGMFLMYWGDPSEAPIPLLTAPTHLPGFASGGDLVERWERATGMPADHLDYFVAFSLWRLAVILLGVERRGREGAYGNAVEPARAVLAGAVPGLLERADRLLTRKQTPRQGSRS